MSTLTVGELAKHWEALHESPAYHDFRDAVQAQITYRENELLEGDATQDNLYQREFMRGERCGLKLALVMLETMYETAIADRINEAKENRNESEQTV